MKNPASFPSMGKVLLTEKESFLWASIHKNKERNSLVRAVSKMARQSVKSAKGFWKIQILYSDGTVADTLDYTPENTQINPSRSKRRRKNPSGSSYNTAVSLPYYNGRVTVYSAHGLSDSLKVLRKIMPGLSKAQHVRLAEKFAVQHGAAQVKYEKALNTAARAVWGRNFRPTDYRVSGIGSDEFSEKHKTRLRRLIHLSQNARTLAAVHAYAAKKIREPGTTRFPV